MKGLLRKFTSVFQIFVVFIARKCLANEIIQF
jgi:hypothetical protein